MPRSQPGAQQMRVKPGAAFSSLLAPNPSEMLMNSENGADYAVVVDQVMQGINGSEHLNSIEVTMQIDVNWTRSGCSVVISGTHG